MKKEYAILAVVIIALGGYLFFRNTDRTTYILPELPALANQDISRIEIDKAGEKVAILRKDKAWLLSPGDYPADVNLINAMIDTLTKLKITTLVSETRNYGRYELDEKQGIRVTAFQEDKVVRLLHIGKAAETRRHTHVRLSEDTNVYHAQGNFRHDFDQTVASLRDKSVMAFDKDAVSEFVIETAERKIVAQKSEAPSSEGDAKDANTTQWQTTDGQPINTEAVEKLLSTLAGLKCRSYLTSQAKSDLKNPAYVVRIQSTEPAVLEVFNAEEDSATEIPARSSLREDPFLLADFDIDPLTDFLTEVMGTDESSQP